MFPIHAKRIRQQPDGIHIQYLPSCLEQVLFPNRLCMFEQRLRHLSLFIFVFSFLPISTYASILAEQVPGNLNTRGIPDTLNGRTGTFRYNPTLITKLPVAVKETSGLVFFDGMLWTINDSGNPAELYQIDTVNGKVLHTVIVSNTSNTDWESLTQDSLYIYIGDFGNNLGNRTDLRILKIAKNDLKNIVSGTVQAGIIQFRYPDQKDFNPALNKTNFDCEAFFLYNDSLQLFSKNWVDRKTRHYTLPASPGIFVARFSEVLESDGLITDASINRQGNIVLLGYKNTGGKFWDCFCWLLSGYDKSTFFGGSKTRIELGSALHVGQSEAIILNDDNTAWLSSESIQASILFLPAKLFALDFNSFFIKQDK